jgi:hypothetical protein
MTHTLLQLRRALNLTHTRSGANWAARYSVKNAWHADGHPPRTVQIECVSLTAYIVAGWDTIGNRSLWTGRCECGFLSVQSDV